MDSHFHGNDRKEKTGLMNQAPTSEKIEKIGIKRYKIRE